MLAGEAAAMADSGRTGGPPARDLRYGTEGGGDSNFFSRGRPLGPSERDASRPPSLFYDSGSQKVQHYLDIISHVFQSNS